MLTPLNIRQWLSKPKICVMLRSRRAVHTNDMKLNFDSMETMGRDERMAYLEMIVRQGVGGFYEEYLSAKGSDPIPLLKKNFGAAIRAIAMLNEMSGDITEGVEISITITDNTDAPKN